MIGFGVGVYPRVGGATNEHGINNILDLGLSPRGRGNRQRVADSTVRGGSIPAWGGATALTARTSFKSLGLSPRGRGNPVPTVSPLTTLRVYPRVGGATQFRRSVPHDAEGLSPRGRGNPPFAAVAGAFIRSIPAWAGQPLARLPGQPPRWVYPRVGGATLCGQPCGPMRWSLSPRGRGNHTLH